MRRLASFLSCIFLAGTLISCTPLKQRMLGAGKLIKPGDKIGEMTVEQGEPTLPYPLLWQFCEYMPDRHEPLESSIDCSVPALSGMTIRFGWIATESKLDSNWEAIAWQLSIDGQAIDLEAFKQNETTYPVREENNKSREWNIALMGLSPGAHSLQLSQTMKTAVDDGFNVYQPGRYKHTVHFTVLEKVVYPALSPAAAPGQHPYSSKKAGHDFLLYLPQDYGKDAEQEWPLIVYLHGAPLRGATLELLMQEPLPSRLGKEKDFPFIVVSPLGDGGYEFWAKDEMIDPLFTLLDEIRNSYAVDAKRIYLTGNDMGGNGVWVIGLKHPQYFAALAPLAGYSNYPFGVPKNICDLKDVPLWAFHGRGDELVPVQVEQDLVDALVACGGKARLTIIDEMKNDVPYKVYAGSELYDWLLSQSRK